MADAEQFNADQLAFWNGVGGSTWVKRQEHTDITLAPVSDALLAFAAPRAGEQVLDVGCGYGASTLELARVVGPAGRVAALDISAPMLAEGQARAEAAGIANVDWQQADAATAALDGYDLLVSNCGLMFFGDPVAAFAHMRSAASPGARMAFVCWRPLPENPWMKAPMDAVSSHLPSRPKPNPQAPGMFAFADPQRVSQVLTAAGWAPPRLDRLDLDLDIAAGRGLEEAVAQWTRSAPSTAGCAANRRRSLKPPSHPFARRWRRIWTARACACPLRCGWSAARPPEQTPGEPSGCGGPVPAMHSEESSGVCCRSPGRSMADCSCSRRCSRCRGRRCSSFRNQIRLRLARICRRPCRRQP